jgi:hypothetical protein
MVQARQGRVQSCDNRPEHGGSHRREKKRPDGFRTNEDMGIRRWFGRGKVRPGEQDHSLELSRLDGRVMLGVTCLGKRDGGGAQVHAVMSAMLFARAMGVPYFHTPFAAVMHGADPAAFAVRWEGAFNLGGGAARIPRRMPVITGEAACRGYRGPPAVVAQQHFHAFADSRPDLYACIVDDLRRRLTLPSRSSAAPTIAVHVRRGDVVGKLPYAKRFTDNATLARHIGAALRDFPGHRVRIFSQGAEADFGGLPDVCEFELDADIFATLSGLIEADCLIMAKSSLSYVAGLYSRGTVYYEPFWHRPLSSWRILD